MTAGYSATPLVRKLGLREGMRASLINMPASVREEIGVAELALSDQLPLDFCHMFATRLDELSRELPKLKDSIVPNGMIWISWPKRASGVESDITEDMIRKVALPLGLIDVKVCAVDTIWSGLKLVIRKELR